MYLWLTGANDFGAEHRWILLVHGRCTMTRLSISVDPELLEEVLRLAKVRTKREAIE